MPCSNGQSFSKLAKHRISIAGRMDVACGCGQGVFGESLCPMDPMGYTVSSFISTTPSAGIFAGLAYGCFSSNFFALRAAFRMVNHNYWFTLAMFWLSVVFMVVFGIFLFASDCIFLKLHQYTTTFWFVMLLANDLGLTFSLYTVVRSKARFGVLLWVEATIICIGLVAGILAFTVFNGHLPLTPSITDRIPYSFPPDRIYWFFLLECVAISSLFLVGPVQTIYLVIADEIREARYLPLLQGPILYA